MAHLFISLLLLLPLLHSCTIAQQNISLGSTLNPEGPNKSWLSPSGDFAFGFRPLETNSSLYLLAIWFDQIDQKTVVWYAHGTNAVTVPSGSSLQLTPDGMLSLRDPIGTEVWTSHDAGGAYASMNNSGNFAIFGADGSPKWQSFTAPADTILPSQELPSGTVLQARLTDTDYSNGRFILSHETNGNLTFYPVAVPSGFKYESDAYWSTNTSENGWKLVYDVNGTIYYTSKNSTQPTIISIMSADMDSTENFYRRATLDPDGVLRQYKYPKKEAVKRGLQAGWIVVQSVPTNICSIIYSDFGSGVCGYNSYCRFNWNQTQTECVCAPQYSFFDQERKFRGCKPDFALQNCNLNEAQVMEQFHMMPMNNIDWPQRAYEQYYPINESTCQDLCLTDCFCAAAVFHEDGHCWKKKLPLSNGREGSEVWRTVFLKVPKNNNSQPQLYIESSSKWVTNRKDWILGGSILLGSSVFLNLFISAQFLIMHRRISRKKKIPSQPWYRVITRAFSYKELEEATNGFSEEVGRGASGVVYKGHLHAEFGTSIAVKKIDRIPRETEKEFTMEVETIGHTLHKNLVQLLGFCYEGTERLLVYPFMANGSLTKFLFSGMRPSWDLRVDIAHGVARGLLYLHEECGKQIIHCDIKPENILLDDNFVAKISDFGLAKLLKAEQTQTSTGIRGTRGYFAPEWFKNVGISSKVDVYSFGVVLLEIVCCRRNVDLKVADEDKVILTYWAYDCYRHGQLGLLVEDDEEAMINMKMVERFMTVALWCIQDEPAMRPTMLKVNKMLDGAIDTPQAPLNTPTFISSLL